MATPSGPCHTNGTLTLSAPSASATAPAPFSGTKAWWSGALDWPLTQPLSAT
ncbi:hypothetical protein D9M68_966490 [compost metagenome]